MSRSSIWLERGEGVLGGRWLLGEGAFSYMGVWGSLDGGGVWSIDSGVWGWMQAGSDWLWLAQYRLGRLGNWQSGVTSKGPTQNTGAQGQGLHVAPSLMSLWSLEMTSGRDYRPVSGKESTGPRQTLGREELCGSDFLLMSLCKLSRNT